MILSIRQVTAAAFVLAALVGSACAQDYPNRTIRIVVPFLAGGPSDVVARLIAQQMSENWKQPVIIDNRPGGNTIVGADAVAKSAPDGYTLLQASDSTLTMNQSLYDKLPYDPDKDFAPVTLSSWTRLILVTDAATGPKTVQELFAMAKADPGKVSFGSGNITTRLAGELLKRMAGIEMQYIPYRGSAGSVRGLMTGDVTVIIDGVPTGLPHIQSGKFRVLANLSSQPIEVLPGLLPISSVPGMKDYDAVVWNGLVAPAGTPADIRNKLSQEVARIFAMPEVRAKLIAAGVEPEAKSPEEFGAFVKRERERWSKVIKESGAKPE
jgi:tripartite-type tricarboxylate transporter receptor subunit TctC